MFLNNGKMDKSQRKAHRLTDNIHVGQLEELVLSNLSNLRFIQETLLLPNRNGKMLELKPQLLPLQLKS